jgi:hypothetical protein
MNFIAKHNIRFEDAAAQRQHDGGDHNRREKVVGQSVFTTHLDSETPS